MSEHALAILPVTGLKSARKLTRMKLISPFGRTIRIKHPRPIMCVNRAEYDGRILEMAVEAGARHLAERVRDLQHDDAGWHVVCDGGSETYDILCGADGVRSRVARTVGCSLPGEELGFTTGFFGPVGKPKSEILVRFGNHVGYCWVLNRKDQASIGVGGPMHERERLEAAFDDFVGELGLNPDDYQRYSWMIPFPHRQSFLQKKKAGKDWLLVGDAAGFCDPLTGEGIQWALESALLADEAIGSGDVARYDELWKRSIGTNLRYGIANRRLLASRPMAELLLNALKSNPQLGMSIFKTL